MYLVFCSCEANALPKFKINTDSLTALLGKEITKEVFFSAAQALYNADSNNKQYVLFLAQAYAQSGDKEVSELYLYKSLLKDSLFLPALAFKAAALLDSEQLYEANQLIEKIFLYYPEAGTSFLLKAKYYYAIGKWDEAKNFSLQALAVDENLCGARILNAMTLMKMDEYKSAVTQFQKCVSEIKKNSFQLNNYGVCLLKSEQFSEAATVFKSALMIDNTQPVFYYNLGLTNMNLGEYNDALSALTKVKSIADTLSEIDLLMAKCYERTYQFNTALEAYKNYQKRNGKADVSKNIMALKATAFIAKNWYYLIASVVLAIIILIMIFRKKN